MAVLSVRTAKIAASAYAAMVLATVYYVTRVANFTLLSQLPNTDTFAFSAMAVPPLLAVWIGARLARNAAAGRLLAAGLIAALAVFVVTFIAMTMSDEPLAPLGLFFVSLWIALGLTLLLLAVWLVGRRLG